MNDFLAQIIAAARRRGVGGWVNILFIVVVAIFYVVGSALKAKANKAQKQDKEQLTHKPTRAPLAGRGGLEQQPLQHRRRPASPVPTARYEQQVPPPLRKVARPGPAVRKFAAKEERAFMLPTVERLEVEKLSRPAPLAKAKELLSEPLRNLAENQVSSPTQRPQTKYLSEILLDYADPDELKTAILHYEILGKPLSLRDPSARVIGL